MGKPPVANQTMGVGLGLRWELADELFAGESRVDGIDFLEVSPENYIGRGGAFATHLEKACAHYPILTHGLTLSVGGYDDLDAGYLEGLRAFVARVKSPWHSDHLCFGSVRGTMMHDLLPIAFNASEVDRIADRIKRAEDVIGVPFAIENISFYMHPETPQMSEAEFVARICERADCKLMLDVNNAYVNSVNFGFDVDEWMRTVPLERVVQIHVAGHDEFTEEGERVIVDTHGAPVCDPVLALLERVLSKTGPVPVLLERDQAIPPLPVLIAELHALKTIWSRAVGVLS